MTRRRVRELGPAVLAALLAWGAAAGSGAGLLTTVCVVLLAGLVMVGVSAALYSARRAEEASRRSSGTLSELKSRSGKQPTKPWHEQLARQTAAQLRSEAKDDVAQVEATVQLVALLQPEWPLPRLRGWAASPDALLALSTLVREERPALVVDLGSGSSTLIVGLTLKRFGIAGRVVGVDHDAVYAEKTRTALRRHGLEDVAEVRVAPLRPLEVDGRAGEWYDTTVFEDLRGAGVVFVDGPPGLGGPEARYPALPVLRDRLAPGAVLLVDDAGRPDETAIVAEWERVLGATAEWLPLEKGGALLRLPRGADGA